MLFLEEMTAVQVRLKCLWKVALASALHFVLSTIYIQVGKWKDEYHHGSQRQRREKSRKQSCFASNTVVLDMQAVLFI